MISTKIRIKFFWKSLVPSLPPISPNGENNQQNLNNVLVITKNDLDRIHGHLNKRQTNDDAYHEEKLRKQELYEKSRALTKNWNNTIEGSRRLKLQQKSIREDKLEKERQAVDVEHAKIMAEERKKDLERAKLLQYHETDKVKNFHSAMRLTEVLKEREAQIELKKLVDQLKQEQEQEILDKFNALQAQKDAESQKKHLKKQEETAKIRQFQIKQWVEWIGGVGLVSINLEYLLCCYFYRIMMKEEQSERAREEVWRDKEMIDELNEQYLAEKKQLADIRKKKMGDLKEEYDRTLENKIRNKEAEQIIDEEENEEIRTYANAKKKMAIMKRQKDLAIMKWVAGGGEAGGWIDSITSLFGTIDKDNI